MNHPYLEEDIIRYIRGEMVKDQLESFERELDSNKELKEEVRELRTTIGVIDRQGEQLLKERFKRLEKRHTLKKWIYIFGAVILVIVLGLVIKKGIRKEKPIEVEAIYAENFQKYRPPVTIRSDENKQSTMSTAIQAYKLSDYKKAFDQFDMDCDNNNQEACFYAILSAIYDGNIDYQVAKNTLIDSAPYSAIILWYEGLLKLKQNKKTESIRYFEKLSKEHTYKRIESLEILDRLRQSKE